MRAFGLLGRIVQKAIVPALLLCNYVQADEPAAPAKKGVAVLALHDASAPTWPLAQAVYARESLRPRSLDEAQARILAGEPAGSNAPTQLRDLAEVRATITGDNEPSRRLLASISERLQVEAIVVVEENVAASILTARVYDAQSAAFDAARYEPDDPNAHTWDKTVRSLERLYGPKIARSLPPTGEVPPPVAESSRHRPFYASAWFWGALGGALLVGSAIYFVTRDNSADMIHLQMQVPRNP